MLSDELVHANHSGGARIEAPERMRAERWDLDGGVARGEQLVNHTVPGG